MRLPAFTNTLHFRLSALFLVLLSVSGVGFWLWINATILSHDVAAEEEAWYETAAEVELDSMALVLSERFSQTGEFYSGMSDYGKNISGYDAELIIFDPDGNYLASSSPDSLEVAIPRTDSGLLAEMSGGDWDYSSYPDQSNIDAYENRIFEVDHLHQGGDPDAPLIGYLAANFRPVIVGVAELDGATRTLGMQAVALGLIYAALSGLIILGWTTRRLRHLSAGVAEFTAGNLAFRVNAGSRDEIGTLGRGFNAMAEGMERTLDQLRHNEQFQRQLIANISHDLRTPMASLRGYVETMGMQARTLDETERDKYLHIITGNLDHLDRLIEHTMVLSRFDSGQTTFQMEEFFLTELVDSVVIRCQALADSESISLVLRPECRSSLVVADPLQIAQVLQNLIENAIKFNRPGGHVEIVLTADAERLAVEVTDTGLGIAAEDLPHIFERFYTGSKSRTRTSAGMDQVRAHLGQSVGLGLAIAAKIVAGHDSQLTATSELGSGSSFRFHLAAAQNSEEQEGSA
jgi:signal transduction histidine kinase